MGSLRIIRSITLLFVVELLCHWDVVVGNDHWAYQRPGRPELPRLAKPEQAANAVDHFILDRLTKYGMTPTALAKPGQQARRVFLDLVGRPPQPGEVDDFLANPNRL